MGAALGQSPFAVHPLQVPVDASHTGVFPEQSLDVTQPTHVCVVVLQMAVGAAQSTFVAQPPFCGPMLGFVSSHRPFMFDHSVWSV